MLDREFLYGLLVDLTLHTASIYQNEPQYVFEESPCVEARTKYQLFVLLPCMAPANIDAALVIFPESELLDNEAIPYHPVYHVQLYHIEPSAVDVAVPFFLEPVGRHSPNAASNPGHTD